MSHKHRREDKPSHYSHQDKAKLVIRQAYNKSSNTSNSPKQAFNLNLYENDREERIKQIADDDDGDLMVEQQLQPIYSEKISRTIEANDRRHDAVIFGDKQTEGKYLFLSKIFISCSFYLEQQKNQLWNSFKQSSKYATASLAGPLLLEDREAKRLRWKNKTRDLWIQRHSVTITKTNMEMD